MDQSQQESTVVDGQVEPKLKIDKVTDGTITALRFSGIIDEQFHGKTVAATIKPGTLVIDMAEVTRISSFGIREWVDFITEVGPRCPTVVFIELAPKVVDQFNMVANFGGHGKILSFYAPYRCDYCDDDRRKLLQFDRDREAIRSGKPPEMACPSCGNPEYFDEDAATFFSFLNSQPAFEVDPQLGTFLGARMNYALFEGTRHLRADKTISGRMTYVHLAGDLDGSFPREKLAEGLEGDVIFDLADIGKIDPAGAAEWRNLMREIAAPTDRIFLWGCPPVFVERLTHEEDLGGKAQVLTFAMPYSCSRCSTTASYTIDVDQHFDVLKFATPPEMKCSDCGGETVCGASDGLLTRLAALPRPSSESAIQKFVETVQEDRRRASAAALPAAGILGAPGVPPLRGQNTVSVLIGAAMAILVVLGGLLVWKLRGGAPLKDDEGQLVETSEGKPPGWIHQEFYRDNDNIYFTGSSAFLAGKDDAIYEASAAAVERAVNQLGAMVRNGRWIDVVLNQFQAQRARLLADLEKATVEGDVARIAAALAS
jgi:anti-anti-sigma regulatory factor